MLLGMIWYFLLFLCLLVILICFNLPKREDE